MAGTCGTGEQPAPHLHDGCNVEAQQRLGWRQVQRLLQPTPRRIQVVRIIERPAAAGTHISQAMARYNTLAAVRVSGAGAQFCSTLMSSQRSSSLTDQLPNTGPAAAASGAHRAFHHSSLDSWLWWKRRSAVVNCCTAAPVSRTPSAAPPAFAHTCNSIDGDHIPSTPRAMAIHAESHECETPGCSSRTVSCPDAPSQGPTTREQTSSAGLAAVGGPHLWQSKPPLRRCRLLDLSHWDNTQKLRADAAVDDVQPRALRDHSPLLALQPLACLALVMMRLWESKWWCRLRNWAAPR